jgi:hypothetical protein
LSLGDSQPQASGEHRQQQRFSCGEVFSIFSTRESAFSRIGRAQGELLAAPGLEKPRPASGVGPRGLAQSRGDPLWLVAPGERPSGSFLSLIHAVSRAPAVNAPELSIITHAFELSLWTIRHIERFPRVHRFGLGARLETTLHSLLNQLLAAKYRQEKLGLLDEANLLLEQLRYQFRFARELRLLAIDSHHHACERVDRIGRELGGWRRQVRART